MGAYTRRSYQDSKKEPDSLFCVTWLTLLIKPFFFYFLFHLEETTRLSVVFNSHDDSNKEPNFPSAGKNASQLYNKTDSKINVRKYRYVRRPVRSSILLPGRGRDTYLVWDSGGITILYFQYAEWMVIATIAPRTYVLHQK